MSADYSSILARCKDKLFFYSPYNFIRGLDHDAIFEHTILTPWLDGINRGIIQVKQVIVESEPHFLLIQPLRWDTEFFGFPVYKILTVLYAHDNYSILKEAMIQLTSELSNEKGSYCVGEIPSEDTYLIQAICECGFRLTETRLHYVKSQMESSIRKRYQVRMATEDDIDNLISVAITMRQPFDRLHADIAINQEIADAYIGTLIANSVRGYADFVLVPSVGDGQPDAFLACSLYPDNPIGKKVARVGVAAVSNKTRVGWYPKLLAEAIHVLKDKKVAYVVGATQASNRGVHRTNLLLGFSVGYVTHIFAKSVFSRT
jgi:dTDP-4-amino-4,6-dideoxy-D-galactose acyltransferase